MNGQRPIGRAGIPEVLTVKALAVRWDLNEKTIRAAIQAGKIPVLPFTRPIRISIKVVEFLETQGCVDLPEVKRGSST